MYRVLAVTIDKCKNISFTKGNSALFKLTIKKNGQVYDYSDDTVRFTVKTDIYTNDILIQKTFSGGQIEFEPSDTDTLDYGVYKYDVELKTSSGKTYTVITPRDFNLTGRVTSNA